tara:strand:- start:1356 stop:1511 length:156 start_codon:yes stop_codon:yes gene_type:complete
MTEEFLEKLIIKYPNFMELGAAVTRYKSLLNDGIDIKEIEKQTLSGSFRTL